VFPKSVVHLTKEKKKLLSHLPQNFLLPSHHLITTLNKFDKFKTSVRNEGTGTKKKFLTRTIKFQLKPTPRVGKCVFHGGKSFDKTRVPQTQNDRMTKKKYEQCSVKKILFVCFS
jgi:hypothetical protein